MKTVRLTKHVAGYRWFSNEVNKTKHSLLCGSIHYFLEVFIIFHELKHITSIPNKSEETKHRPIIVNKRTFH